MSQVKRACLEALRTDFVANVSGMTADKVRVVARDAEMPTKYPSIQVVAGKFKYIPRDKSEIKRVSASQVLWGVGRFDGDVEIRTVGDTPAAREGTEEAVLARFLGAERPGTLKINTANLVMNGTATLYASPCTFALTGEEWIEERVWERRRFSFITAKASFEALFLDPVGTTYTMSQIYLMFTRDLHTPYPAVKRTTYLITANGPVKQ